MTSVLITGANKGLGHETARRLGELGWRVFLGSRDEGRGRAAAQKLAADGAHVVMVPLDVTSEESVVAAGSTYRTHLLPGLEVRPDSIPELLERFGLRLGE